MSSSGFAGRGTQQSIRCEALRGLLLAATRWIAGPARPGGAKISVQEGVLNISRGERTQYSLRSGYSLQWTATWAAWSRRCNEWSRKNLKLPPGYNITWGGEFENQQRAMGRLIMIIPVQHSADLRGPVRGLQNRQKRCAHPA